MTSLRETRAGGAAAPPKTYGVVVCGSNYGRVYLSALESAPDRFRPSALLARGSERSEALAKRHGLELVRHPGDLPPGLDIACAALPSSADEVVLELIEGGLHVLLEHPRPPSFLERAFDAAERRGVRCHVNGHFGDLPAARAFIERCRRLAAEGPVRRLEIACQDRALYGGLDILTSALGPAPPVPNEIAAGRLCGDFHGLATTWRGVPFALAVQAPAGAADGSPRYLVDLRLVAVFDSGTLALQSMAGPVVWNANLMRSGGAGQVLWEVLTPPQTLDDLRRARDDANLLALDRLRRHVEEGEIAPEVERERTLAVARWWRRLGDSF